jgi:hypothetical protein
LAGTFSDIEPWQISVDLALPRVPAAPELYISVRHGPSALAVGHQTLDRRGYRVQVPVRDDNVDQISFPLLILK